MPHSLLGLVFTGGRGTFSVVLDLLHEQILGEVTFWIIMCATHGALSCGPNEARFLCLSLNHIESIKYRKTGHCCVCIALKCTSYMTNLISFRKIPGQSPFEVVLLSAADEELCF